MPEKILIVDDSSTARMFVQRCLEIIGKFKDAEYYEAGDGKEALEILSRENISYVFSDLTMPEMDGESLCRRMKASPKLNEIPIIVISSAGNPAKDAQLIEMGVKAIIKKPVSPAKIAEITGGL